MRGIVLLIVCLSYTGWLFYDDIQNGVIAQFARQYVSLKFPSTSGHITQSEISGVSSLRLRKTIAYRANIRYIYQINGQSFEGSAIRHEAISCKELNLAKELIACYPVGLKLRVYYNPDNPSDALLSPGISGEDFVSLLARFPFYLAVIWMWAMAFDWIKRDFSEPPAEGVEVLRETQRLRVRLPPFRPMSLAIIGWAVSWFFVGQFIIHDVKHPSITTCVSALCFVTGAGVFAFLWLRQAILAGRFDLVIQKDLSIIETPRTIGRGARVILRFSEISAIAVTADRSSHFILALQLRGDKCKPFKLAKWKEREKAEAFAAWLRRQVGCADQSLFNSQQ